MTGARLLEWWRALSGWPAGAWLFSRAVGLVVPYTGSLRARVLKLAPGRAVAQLSDRRAVRNHLRSIHAVALVNLGEFVSGLALLTALEPGVRGIVVGIEVEYLKKARGRLVAVSSCSPPEVSGHVEYCVHSDIKDEAGESVARTSVRWRLSAVPEGRRAGRS